MKQTIKASTEDASSIPAIAANPPRSSFDPIVAEVHAIRQACLINLVATPELGLMIC
jgi:hypothetical protein